MSKRKRDPTFTTSEKEALLKLVTTHFFIIESKKTDAVSMKHKTEEWRKIATEFNAISSIYFRDWKVLKNCWENLKKKAKHEQSLRNQHIRTGGRLPRKEDPLINRVLELIQARVFGFVDCSDSDGTKILDMKETDCESQLQVKLNESSTTTSSSDMITADTRDCAQHTSRTLRERINSVQSLSLDVHQQPPDSQECHALSNPPRVQTSIVTGFTTANRSHRRQVYKEKLETSDIMLSKEKMKTSLRANAHAIKEEHQIKLKILRLQEEKEKETLKQEILKTKQEEIKLQILEIQLKKLKD